MEYALAAELTSKPGLPNTYKQAMATPDAQHWIGGIVKEITNFDLQDVYEVVLRSSMPPGKRAIGTRWIFKKKVKEDGTIVWRARTVAQGNVQIPGVDFSETFAPTANDTATRCVFAITLHEDDWVIHIIDIETAFLEAILNKRTWVEIPEGYKSVHGENDQTKYVWFLKKAMYGLVQAPKAFYDTFAGFLTSPICGMTKSQVDPCVFYTMDKNGKLEIVMAIHVDDCAICGKLEAVNRLKEIIKTRFSIKDEGRMSKHLRVYYEWLDNGSLKIHQDGYIKDIIQLYEELHGPPKSFETPGYPGDFLARNTGEEADKTNYRSIVGKLLFALKKTYPELANSVRMCAQHMDRPGNDHWRAIARIVGYLKHKANHGMIFRKPTDLDVIGFVNSNYASNKEDRKSISGYTVLVGGCLVSWASKGQPSVTLSSTEAEYVAASMCATEIKFVQMLMEELRVSPSSSTATLNEDNQGAIYVIRNDQVGQHTKHIDVKWHHVREMVKSNRLRVIYIRSEENPSDILTKNTKEITFVKHAGRLKDGTLLIAYDNRENVVMCCVVMEVLPDDVMPSHGVAYTTEQCHDSPKSEFPQRRQGPAWIDKLPIEMFTNPFYGVSKDNEHAILQALQEDKDREWDAGWREVPDRYRERWRKRKQSVKPK
jgi:Reverse transcriptase (RNA-dependent DNA polymerase)